jgi:LysR family nitrogen assimilation transcriptional regulator
VTLAQLINFIRIAELQSLSKAAAVVRIAQPALSRQLRSLETELNTPLLIRHARGVSLTAAGEILLVRARRILLEADKARDAVQALAVEPTGRVALGVPASLATALLPPLVAAVTARYPRIRLHLVDGFSAALHARTLSGDLDLAILYEDRAMGPLSTSPLISEALMLIGPARGVAPTGSTADRLAGKQLILPAHPNRLRLIIDEALVTIGEVPQIVEVDSLPAITAMVQRDAGWTILPYSTVADGVARRELRAWDMAAAKLSRTLVLARPVDRDPTSAIAAVEVEIRRLVDDLSNEARWTSLAGRGQP